ncbi:MAG TPA: OmpA family protein [Verrucomicrobiae bacterium]|nr:OmpA family protein [Verrucomicrobiae bacterium]
MHPIRAWFGPLLAAGLATLFIGTAAAQDVEYQSVPEWYLGPLAGFAFGDSARNTDEGVNLGGVVGMALAESLAVELNMFSSELPSTVSGASDTSLLSGGLTLALGTPAPGNPFFLLGGGAVEQEVASIKQSTSYGELGMGFYLPFSVAGELWRIEGRYQLVINDDTTPGSEELFEDGRVNLGVLFTFGDLAPEVIPLEEPELAPDLDADGVPDAQDKCPDTPRWVRPDANGCSPDIDGDGIEEGRDACPATPAGTAVDANGCPIPEAQPAAPVQPASTLGDEDFDGVADGVDACPHTTPRLDIDANGCVKPETVQLRNVHFDLDSTRLTGDGYILLRQVGAALKADPNLRLEVAGHADAIGPDRYNMRLSKNRAEVVRDFLTYMGIADDRLTLQSFGETRPLRENTSDEGRAMNRRVEFRRL